MIPDWIIFIVSLLVVLWAFSKDNIRAYRAHKRREKQSPLVSQHRQGHTAPAPSRWMHRDSEKQEDLIDISNPTTTENEE